MAGRTVRCPECEAVNVVPDVKVEEGLFSPDDDDPAAEGLAAAFNRDLFLFRQKVFAISEKYMVWDDQERPVLYIERPARAARQVLAVLGTVSVFILTFSLSLLLGIGSLQKMDPGWVGGLLMGAMIIAAVLLTGAVYFALTPKRHIAFYADESKERLLLQVRQDQKFQVPCATYTVLDPEGRRLARMEKNYLYDIFRKRWNVRDADSGKLLWIAREDSLMRSVLRRFLGSLYGFLRTNFVYIVPEPDGIEVARGEFNRQFTLFDRYVLDLTADRPRRIDRRLAVALGVLLDTGESR